MHARPIAGDGSQQCAHVIADVKGLQASDVEASDAGTEAGCSAVQM